MNNKKARVLLCGTIFGQIYLRGVLDSNDFQLAGILSNGSEQSRSIASKYQVQIYTNVENISEEQFDLALVVIRSGIVGGSGNKIVQKLLRKQISVIQEQPVHMEEAIKNYKIAKKNNVFYKVNTFYTHLPSSICFHSKIKELKSTSQIYSIDGACSLPVLLPFLDQIGEILGGISPYTVNSHYCYSTEVQNYISGSIKGVDFMFRIQTHMNSENLMKYAYELNEINVMTGLGNLKLTEVNGQVIWISKPYVVEEYLRCTEKNERLDVNGTEILYDASGKKYSELYSSIWPKAITHFLAVNTEAIINRKCNAADMQYYMALCRLWKEISTCICITK